MSEFNLDILEDLESATEGLIKGVKFVGTALSGFAMIVGAVVEIFELFDD